MSAHAARLALLLILAGAAGAVEAAKQGDAPEDLLGDAKEWIASLQLPPGTEGAVWAQGPQAANPVAIALDDRNRLYLAQTFRWRLGGVVDIRNNLFMYAEDIRLRSLAERREMYVKWAAKWAPDFFTARAEQVAVIEEGGGTGVGDRSRVLAGGFADVLDGTAAGVLAHEGAVYFANIPAIWKLIDADGDGVAEQRRAISEGYGIRVGISGHDLHGLIAGPDGRLYWSIGDRGYDVTGQEGQRFIGQGSGAVFRSEPDGSRLELVHAGLRNPQELAFDAEGDLFTCDNNADIGDRARMVRILEGASSGWHAGWQMLANNGFAKAAGLAGQQPCPWLEEGLWKERFAGQPAWIIPASGYATAGPSGLAVFPETGWGAQYQGRFLVCDYRGSVDSGVRLVTLEPRGAGHQVVDEQKFLWGLTTTDIDFASDGRLFVANYLGGWLQAEVGRILTLRDPALAGSREVKEVATLLATGFAKRPPRELGALLGHVDRRVRQRAQAELARRGADGAKTLLAAARGGATVPARLHGIWGLGQAGRRDAKLLAPLIALLGDPEARAREQAAKVLGDERFAPASAQLVPLLADPSARARCFAAIALARLAHRPALPALIDLLRANADADASVRHAAVYALAAIGDADALAAHAGDASRAVRLGVLLAQRRLGDARLAGFLADAEPEIAAEAVRAIYDLPLDQALHLLPAQLGKAWIRALPEALGTMIDRRLVHAARRIGDGASALLVAGHAARADAPVAARVAALDALAGWDEPLSVDPVAGMLQPAGPRLALDGAAIKPAVMRIIAEQKPELLATAVVLAQRYAYGLEDATLLAIVDDPAFADHVRSECLRQLTGRRSTAIAGRLPKLLVDDNAGMRAAAFDAQLALDAPAALATAQAVLDGKLAGAVKDVSVFTARSETSWEDLSMGPPVVGAASDSSAANGAVVTAVVERFSKPHKDAGLVGDRLPRLTDDGLPANDDDTARSVWFDGGEARFVLDLGKPVDVARITTHSWHRKERAPQQFTLWGADAASMPDTLAGEPSTAGWTRIAGVDTVGLGEGGRHGSCVLSGSGSLGTYRWLMWHCHKGGTFFSKIGVFAQGRALPDLRRVVTARTQGGWEELITGAPLLGAEADSDAANGAVVTWIDGFAKPHAKAGAEGARLPRLNDGRLPANDDDIAHNVWADGGESRLLLDLGKSLDVARVTTYSWHRANRAPQRFSLWGCDGDLPDPSAKELVGWTHLADVDTTGLGEGGKHASCVLATSDGKGLGRFRFLLWRNAEAAAGTFYSQLVVSAVGRTLPPVQPVDPVLQPFKQHVLLALGAHQDAAAGALLAPWLERLLAGTLTPALALDLVEAIAKRPEPELQAKLAAWRATLPANDPLTPFRLSLEGGDAWKGRELFRFHATQCLMCHAVDGDGGTAAPELRGVANRLGRLALVESMVLPSALVAPGYGTSTVFLTDGSELAGAITRRDAEGLTLRLADGKERVLAADQVEDVQAAVSIMPPMGERLTPREVRDLVAYLASLK